MIELLELRKHFTFLEVIISTDFLNMDVASCPENKQAELASYYVELPLNLVPVVVSSAKTQTPMVFV